MRAASAAIERHRKAQPWIGLVFIGLLMGGWLYPPLGYFMVFCMVMAMGYGVIKGRYWCDWMCPRGSFWDYFLSRFSRQTRVPALFRHPGFRLFWMGLLMTMLAIKLPPLWGNWYLMGKPFITLLSVTTGVGLILGIVYHHRIWCMFCPMGTMANILGRNKHQLTVSEACTSCQRCSKVCRMQIEPGAYRQVGIVAAGDCLKCSYCVDECPKGALGFAGNSPAMSRGAAN